MGEITAAIIHPVEGKLMGLIVRTDEGQERALATPNFFIGKDAVMATAGARFTEDCPGSILEHGVSATGEIVGTYVVTEDGKLLGRVSELHVPLRCPIEMPGTIYRVSESTLQRFLGGGFYIGGDLPCAYSRDGVRMIVPADTEERYAVKTIDEAFGALRQDCHQESMR